MNSTTEILILIDQNNNKIDQIDKKIDSIKEQLKKWREMYQFKKFSDRDFARFDALKDEEEAAQHEKYIATLYKKIYWSNYRIALFNEVRPAICEIFEKYNGKPYGEKTRQKIRDEIKAATGCDVYISLKYCSWDEIVISNERIRYSDQIECSPARPEGETETPRLLINNKINAAAFKLLRPYDCGGYIENPEARIAELLAAYEELKKQKDDFKKAISKFNNLAVRGLPHITENTTLYKTIF